ncbi:MAG: ribulose-phosphate 3-epimerase, partial [Rickettsiales bacterium]|nr:ribulose-phosphate 3-epimerase [Rickettsiales bacterium]
MINLSIGLPSADFFRLDRALGKIEKSVADAVHFDIMDGNFVPAITYGPKVLADLRPHSGKFFDAHLMVADPLAQVAAFALAGADMITVHAEAP